MSALATDGAHVLANKSASLKGESLDRLERPLRRADRLIGTDNAALFVIVALIFATLASLLTLSESVYGASVAPLNLVSPQLTSETPRQGNSLSVTNGSWANMPVSYHYVWSSCNSQSEECTSIGGASTSTYTPGAADVGKTLRATVVARNAGGESNSVSEASAPVLAAAPLNTEPPNITPVAPMEGLPENVNNGAWTFSSGAYAYQWRNCNSAGEACVNISGATTKTYTPGAIDVGAMLEVVVTAVNHGVETSASSGSSGRLVLAASPGTSYAPHRGTVFSSANSVWNTVEGENLELDSSSPSLVETVATWGARRMNGIDTTTSSTPIYTVPADQSKTKVVLDWNRPPLNLALRTVPMPSMAIPARGSDEHLVVYQPSSDQLWEFWHLREGLPPPTVSSFGATVTSGGHLGAGTYYYCVTALSAVGETTPSAPFAVSVPQANSAVSLSFKGVIYGQSYRIYRGTEPSAMGYVGILHQSTNVYGSTVIYSDTGSTSPANAPPTTNTAATPGQWHAGWAGHITSVSRDAGYYRLLGPAIGPPIEEPEWGATASSLPIADGVITLGDLEHGEIDHAMQLLVPTARAAVHSFPAQRTDGGEASASSVPEGAHFMLRASIDCSQQTTPFMRMTCVAAQRYGFIVSDQTGGGLALRAEDPTPLMQAGGLNPYPTYFADHAGKVWQPYQMMAAFPWSALHLLPMKLAAQNEPHL